MQRSGRRPVPPDVRSVLWPLIAEDEPRSALAAPGREVVTRLVEAHPSILLNLQQRAGRFNHVSKNQEDRADR